MRPARLRQSGTKCAQANAAPTHRSSDSHANQLQPISSSRRYIGPHYGAAARGHASPRRSRLKSNCVPLMASRQRLRATPLPKGSTVMPLAVAAPSFGSGYLCPAGSPQTNAARLPTPWPLTNCTKGQPATRPSAPSAKANAQGQPSVHPPLIVLRACAGPATAGDLFSAASAPLPPGFQRCPCIVRCAIKPTSPFGGMRGGPRSSYVAVLSCRFASLPVQPVRAARAPLRELRQPRPHLCLRHPETVAACPSVPLCRRAAPLRFSPQSFGGGQRFF